MKRITIIQNPAYACAWPDVVLTKQGKLICVYTECAGHLDRTDSRLLLTQSTDRGETWSAPVPLTARGTKTAYYNNARIARTKDGLAIACDFIDGQSEATADCTVHLFFADAEGTAWRGPFPTPMKGIVPDKLRELKSGRWLLSAHRQSPVTGRLEETCRFSDDHGKTWSEAITMAADPGLDLCEACVVETKDALVAFLRENSLRGLDGFRAVSFDEGETWQGVYPTVLAGCHRPTAGLLQSGRLLMTYRWHQGGGGPWGQVYQNTMACLMEADHLTEPDRKSQWGNLLPLDHDRAAPRADTGYTGWAQFDDGEIFVVNYITDAFPRPYICGYRLTEKDFRLDL